MSTELPSVLDADADPKRTASTSRRVLVVYYTHTQQAQRVAESMAGAFRDRGCDVSLAGIEFTDPRYLDRFSRFPFRHAVFDIVPLLWPQFAERRGRFGLRTRRRRAATTSSASARPLGFSLSTQSRPRW